MLDSDELMALLAGLDKGHVQADFKFLGNHRISFGLAVGDIILMGLGPTYSSGSDKHCSG